MNFKNQILLLTDFFNHENIDYAINGAFALHAYGYTRAIKNFETINRREAFSNHLYPVGSKRFDFLYVDGETADSSFNSFERKILFG